MTNPLRMGLVGLNFGRSICEQLSTTPGLPVRLAKVCDLDAAKAQAVAAEFSVAVSPSLEALLQDPEIDVIGLFTGPNGRADLVRRIIRAGRDVMTTKPFELDADMALAVLDEARALGRVVHLNSPNPRPLGETAVIADWIHAGAVGQLTSAHASVWCYYGRTPADGSWYDDPVRCPLAPMFRLGIYPLNVLLSVFRDPVSVQVTHSRIETQRPTPDNSAMTILFRDGAIVTLMASFVVGGPDMYKNSLTLCGTKGVIYYAVGPREGDIHDPSAVDLVTDAGKESRLPRGRAGEYDWDFFARRVRGEVRADVTSPAEIVSAIRVVNAMSLAERSNQTVRIS